ncbi:MAG: hypothetical protein L7H10_03705 [Vulcanisaeta sp.]|nr:hypothetical protein [Vulcanisaeta sp.]MCG2869840.1 hypothetical protein [Vulcanisaeta sp.]MCG2886986.1 hypothetical protein [Vulcanisaeta sp.]
MRHSYLRPLGIGSNNDDAMRIGDKPGSDVPGRQGGGYTRHQSISTTH